MEREALQMDFLTHGKATTPSAATQGAMDEQLPRILMVEDNPGDAYLLGEAMTDAGFNHSMTIAVNGDQAMSMLRGEGCYAGIQRPDLVILDLNLPGKSGHEVLREIKEDPGFASLPVIVFSSSEAERDIALAYKLHANCYIRKPASLDDTVEVAYHLANFWLLTASLPKGSPVREIFRGHGAEDQSSDGPPRRHREIREERILKRA